LLVLRCLVPTDFFRNKLPVKTFFVFFGCVTYVFKYVLTLVRTSLWSISYCSIFHADYQSVENTRFWWAIWSLNIKRRYCTALSYCQYVGYNLLFWHWYNICNIVSIFDTTTSYDIIIVYMKSTICSNHIFMSKILTLYGYSSISSYCHHIGYNLLFWYRYNICYIVSIFDTTMSYCQTRISNIACLGV
jgi:hypothetical protein